MIETPKDGRIQVEKLKYPVEVLAFKLWLDPELVSRVDLKRLYTCQLYAANSSKYVSQKLQKMSDNKKFPIFRRASIRITCKKVHEKLKASNAQEINHCPIEAMQHQSRQYLPIKLCRIIIICNSQSPWDRTCLVMGDKVPPATTNTVYLTM